MQPDALNIPHLDQYSGVWAMHEPAFNDTLAMIRTLDIGAHVQASRVRVNDPDDDDEGDPVYSLGDDGLARVSMTGMMTKYGSSFSSYMGSVRMRRVVRAMAADEKVKGVLMRIDSPGGSVSGTDDLADDVAALAKVKPVTAFIEDLGASGAYYVASQATRIMAGPGALVGSIGTYSVVYDYSQAAAREGIKVMVIRAGKFKGAGITGTEITDEQKAEMQRVIDSINNQFVNRVASGRKMKREDAEAVADGRVHIAADALTLKLIDAIGTLDTAAAELRSGFNARPNRTAIQKEARMSATNETPSPAAPTGPKAATLAELKGLSGSTPEQREAWQEKGFTLAQATAEHLTALSARAAAQDQEIAKLKADAEAAKAAPKVEAKKVGIEPVVGALTAGTTNGSDVVAKWEEAVQAEMKRNPRGNRAEAVIMANRRNPGLRAAFNEVRTAEAKANGYCGK